MAQGRLKEKSGPLAAPLAPVIGEIMGQKAEEVVQPEITKRTLFVGDHNIMETYPEFDAVKSYMRREMKPEGKEIFFYEFKKGWFTPEELVEEYKKQREFEGKTLEEAPKFDRIALLVHGGGEPIFDEKGNVTGYGPALERARPKNAEPGYYDPYSDVAPSELFAQVEKLLKPGGEVWIFSCEQRQREWDDKRRKREEEGEGAEGYFTLTVIPGTGGDCIPRRDIPEYIRKAIED